MDINQAIEEIRGSLVDSSGEEALQVIIETINGQVKELKVNERMINSSVAETVELKKRLVKSSMREEELMEVIQAQNAAIESHGDHGEDNSGEN